MGLAEGGGAGESDAASTCGAEVADGSGEARERVERVSEFVQAQRLGRESCWERKEGEGQTCYRVVHVANQVQTVPNRGEGGGEGGGNTPIGR